MLPRCLFALGLLVSCTSANDGWEFHGGRKKRLTHGLNSATDDQASRKGRSSNRSDNLPQLVITRDEAPPAPKITPASSLRNSGNRPSNDNILLLPNRYSVLNFERNEDAEEAGGEQQQQTVDSSWWGRLYVEGFPGPMQYFRAHFGQHPPKEELKLLLASPITMCDAISGLAILNNADMVDNHTLIIAERGGCTFGEKARVTYESGAAGILFINNEEGNLHPSAADAHDLPISAAMVSRDDGYQLVQALTRVHETNDPGYALKGRYVPVACGDNRSSHSNTYCHPVLSSDKEFVDRLNYKGKMSIEGHAFEYLQGEFGSWIDPTLKWSTVVPSVIGGDSHCCDRAGFSDNELSSYHAILCQRGECDFITKAENVASTGAGMLIVSSHNETMYRMGVDPPHRGRKLTVATAMVGADAHERMVDAYYAQLDFGLTSSLAILQPTFSNDLCENNTEVAK